MPKVAKTPKPKGENLIPQQENIKEEGMSWGGFGNAFSAIAAFEILKRLLVSSEKKMATKQETLKFIIFQMTCMETNHILIWQRVVSFTMTQFSKYLLKMLIIFNIEYKVGLIRERFFAPFYVMIVIETLFV